jgi:hypothetical protein
MGLNFTRMFVRTERTVMKVQNFLSRISLSLLEIDPLAALAGVEASLSTRHTYSFGRRLKVSAWKAVV